MTRRPPDGLRAPARRPHAVRRLGCAQSRQGRALWIEHAAVLLLVVAGPPFQRVSATDAAPPEAGTGGYNSGGGDAGVGGWPAGPGPSQQSLVRQALLQANDLPQNRSAYAQGSSDGVPSTGTSYNNPQAFPVPADYEPVLSAVHRVVGPYVIKARQEMEMAFNSAFANYYQPLGVEVRWLNYTIRPATTIGLAGSYLRSSMRAVDEQVVMYQKKGAGVKTNLTLGSVFNQTAYLQQLVTVDYGFSDASLVVLSEKSISTSFRDSQADYGAASTSIQLSGDSLFPFTVDKQNVVLLTLTAVFKALPANPVFYVNISNFSPDGTNVPSLPPPRLPSGRRLARRLLQDGAAAPSPGPLTPATVTLDVWTGLDPLSGSNMADLWNRTLNQANAQQLYVINGDGGIGVAFTYGNFTSTSRNYGLALTGQYRSSRLYNVSVTGDYTVAVVPPGPPYEASDIQASAPAPAPGPADLLSPGRDFGYGSGPNPANGLPMSGPLPVVVPPKPQRHHSVGLIAGATVGAFFAGALILAFFSLLLFRRRRKKDRAADGKSPAGSSVEGSGSQTPSDSPETGAKQLGHSARGQPWSWDAQNSGVVEPVVLGQGRDNGTPMSSRRDVFPSLHRANELFANDTAKNSGDDDATPSSRGSSRDSGTPHPGQLLGGNITGTAGAAVPSSGPFVAGELDPSEIEICRDSEGKRVLLGEGAFGRVYKGVRRGVHEVAVKQLGNLRDPQIIRQFRKEIEILGRVSFQPNIVNFYGACLRNPANIMLVMELMEGGDLRHALSADESGGYNWWGKGAALALDIAHGLHFLHSSGVTHRDLKTSNILLSKGGTTAKIGDVGLAKITLTDLQSSLATVGTFVYAAPELLMGDRCTEKADIFSFGVCIWEIVTGDIPQRGYLRDVAAPAECPESVRVLLSDCMASDPKVRPSAEELVRRLSAAPHSREAAADEAAALPQQPGGADGALPTSRRVSLQPPIPEGSVQEEGEAGSRDSPDDGGANSGGNSSDQSHSAAAAGAAQTDAASGAPHSEAVHSAAD